MEGGNIVAAKKGDREEGKESYQGLLFNPTRGYLRIGMGPAVGPLWVSELT